MKYAPSVPSLPGSKLLILGAVATIATACTATPSAVVPAGSTAAGLAQAYVAALQAEQRDPDAAGPYLDLIDRAVQSPDAPSAVAAVVAALDALVGSSTSGFEGIGQHAIAFRSRMGATTVTARLRKAWDAPRPPGSEGTALIRGNLAMALHNIALYFGDESAAAAWGVRRGCVPAASVVGPLDWTPLRALDDPSPISATEPLRATYPGVAPFAATTAPVIVRADQCQVDIKASSHLQGLRAVVVDFDIPRAQSITIAFTSASAAVVEVGAVQILARPFEAGGRPVTRFASVAVPAGRARLVARVAEKGESNPIEIDAWDEDGLPLVSRAPRVGDPGGDRAGKATRFEFGSLMGPSGAALAGAALLAVGDARATEHLLEPQGDTADKLGRSPAIELLYARAVDAADDLPDNKALERVRSAVNRVLSAWPESWEAKVGHARATERRRGAGEGVTEALRELGAEPGKPATGRKWDRMIAAYVALTAHRAQFYDIAEDAYADLARRSPGSPLLAGVDTRLHNRVGPEAVQAACMGALRRADLDCLEALRDRGDFAGAIGEIARLRRLRRAPAALREHEISTRILAGDVKGALAIYDAMIPGERRMFDVLGLVNSAGAKARVARDRIVARDAPYALAPLVHALGLEPDPAPHLEEEGRALVVADQKAAFLPGAGTAILRHIERYSVDANGLVHYLDYDLRRVSGTTDVAQGATAYGPSVEGRSAPRLLRKRIHKRDGRVLEPDAAANASQASDLSQLEQGDYIEQIVEGWVLPGDTGQIVIDTPDLLPERTSVREALIEVRRASSIPFAVWAHPLLGIAAERTEGDFRVSTWRLSNQPPRRIEDGVPKMERAVSVSLGTQTWALVGRAIQENIRSLDEHDPYVARWIAEAAGKDRVIGKALVDRVVAAVGKKVKVASGGELSDVSAVFGGGAQRSTARTTLELGQGSRSWVIYRALRELGVPASLAVAEAEPWTAAPTFPAHVGRFRHPLIVAHLGAAGGDVWIDADVDGPPLPPGRVSPELRGRTAMLDTGVMVTVEGSSGETGDEVDVRLALDDKGNAKGTFTVMLHGRTAQALAELFETVVGSDRREMLRSVVLGWLPWADVDDVAVSSNDGSWEVALRAVISIHGFGRPEGKDGKTWVLAGLPPVHLIFPHRAVGTLGATYASRGARQNALSIEVPIQYHVHMRTELPAGAKIERAPSKVAVDDAHVQGRRTTTVTAGVIEEDFALNLPTGTVSPAAYPVFVEKVQAIDDGFMAGTRVRVKP